MGSGRAGGIAASGGAEPRIGGRLEPAAAGNSERTRPVTGSSSRAARLPKSNESPDGAAGGGSKLRPARSSPQLGTPAKEPSVSGALPGALNKPEALPAPA